MVQIRRVPFFSLNTFGVILMLWGLLLTAASVEAGVGQNSAGEGAAENRPREGIPAGDSLAARDERAPGSNLKVRPVALVMKALSNPFFAAMERGAKSHADKAGVQLQVFGVERETDVEHQIAIMERLITQNARAIVLAPADSRRLVPVCKRAIEAGIVVVNIDNPLDSAAQAQAGISIPFVGSDNRAGSRMVGDYIRRKFPQGGRVLYVEGIRGAANADLRRQGFLDGLGGSPFQLLGSESANWHTEEALTLAAEWLARENSPDIIACANDSMALGVLQARDLADASKARVVVTGYDNIPSARTEMTNQRLHATVEQHPDLMGAYGVQLALDLLAGESSPKYVPTPLDLITHETFGLNAALLISNLDNPFFRDLAEGARKAADLQGMTLKVVDAKDDSARQLNDLQGFVEEQVDVILLNPTDAVSLAPGVELAGNIPVITVDRKVVDTEVLCHVASDNRAGGRMAGELLLEVLPRGGRLLEIQGLLGTSAAHDRGTGFNELLLGRVEWVIHRITANFDRAMAENKVAQLLAAGQRYDGVFAHNDEMILGALAALKKAGVTPLPVMIGFDATEEAVLAVKAGELKATIAQRPGDMGRIAILKAAEHFRGFAVSGEEMVELDVVR